VQKQKEMSIVKTKLPTKLSKKVEVPRGSILRKTSNGAPLIADAIPRATKIQQIEKLLRRTVGASLPKLMKITGWRSHSVRGFISGTLIKRNGHAIKSEKLNGDRRYRMLEGGKTS
jgi:hypothetical protein